MKSRRNDPCPCGSGSKFKQCCGRGATPAQPAPAPAIPDLNALAQLIDDGRFEELEVQASEASRRHPQSGPVWKALGIALTSQSKEASQAWRRAAILLPNDAQSHSQLGDCWMALHRFQDAMDAYRRALGLNPGIAEAHNNLGNALRALGRTDEAIVHYRRALEIRSKFSEAHNNLGNALRALGRTDEALASYRRALEVNPKSAEARNNLGNALLDAGCVDEAAVSYRRALEIEPSCAPAHSNLGNALRRLGRLDDALSSYQQALALDPSFAAAHSNISDVLRDFGRLDAAMASSHRAIELDPSAAGAHNSLGNALLDSGRLDEAVASYRQALELRPTFLEALINLGAGLRLLGKAAEAEVTCRRALEIDSRVAAVWVLLAELRADGGEFDVAEELFGRAASIDPTSAEACAGLAHLRKMTSADAIWLTRAQSIVRRGLPPRQEVYLRYAMGKYFDDVQDFERAFEHYRCANEMTKMYGTGFDRQALARAVDRLVRLPPPRSPAAAVTDADARPIFVVGMPRSGTSLAEQILASHPAIVGAGELPFWGAAALDVDAGAVRHLAANYSRLIDEIAPGALRVVDKMPGNFWVLGLIHLALPNARIIHLRRNPVDTCLSIYFQHFKSGHSYANDLHDLAHYYTEYSRVMAHWRSVVPRGAMLDLSYESLVDDQEARSREMMQFVGLPWDPRCLEFHQTVRRVRTASNWQVRQKIHRGSVERWRNYERFAGPLMSLMRG